MTTVRVVGIGGPPASGKSTLVKAAVRALGGWERFRRVYADPVRGYMMDALGLLIIGLYGQETYSGTDRLSMNLQAPTVALLSEATVNPSLGIRRVLFEGDRLFTQSFINQVQEVSRIDLHMMVLAAGPETLEQRRRNRLSFQNDTWIAGRETKLARLASLFPDIFSTHRNETAVDAQENVQTVMRLLDVGRLL